MTGQNHRAIVNFASGGFGTGQDRLNRSLDDVGFKGRRVFFKDYKEGWPTHEDHPYAFKLFAIREAIDAGCTSIVYIDARAWALRPIEPFFEMLERDGIYLMSGNTGPGQVFMDSRCTDACLARSGLTRDEAASVPMLGGSIYGFDFTHPTTKQFFDEWFEWFKAGLFQGAAINEINREHMYVGGYRGRPEGFVSADPRVMGHSHDEACASFIAHRMGLKTYKVGDHYDGHRPEWSCLPNSYFASQGM